MKKVFWPKKRNSYFNVAHLFAYLPTRQVEWLTQGTVGWTLEVWVHTFTPGPALHLQTTVHPQTLRWAESREECAACRPETCPLGKVLPGSVWGALSCPLCSCPSFYTIFTLILLFRVIPISAIILDLFFWPFFGILHGSYQDQQSSLIKISLRSHKLGCFSLVLVFVFVCLSVKCQALLIVFLDFNKKLDIESLNSPLTITCFPGFSAWSHFSEGFRFLHPPGLYPQLLCRRPLSTLIFSWPLVPVQVTTSPRTSLGSFFYLDHQDTCISKNNVMVSTLYPQ